MSDNGPVRPYASGFEEKAYIYANSFVFKKRIMRYLSWIEPNLGVKTYSPIEIRLSPPIQSP